MINAPIGLGVVRQETNDDPSLSGGSRETFRKILQKRTFVEVAGFFMFTDKLDVKIL